MKTRWLKLVGAWTLTGLSLASTAQAVDTLETFDLGASDAELYTGYEGLGLDAEQSTVFSDLLLGYGITRGFSAYFGATLSASGTLAGSSTEAHVGAFGTPIDSAHIDFDLGVDFTREAEALVVTPQFELNLDLEPELSLAGLYARGELAYFGRRAIDDTPEIAVAATSTLGAYLTVGELHQLLLQAAVTWQPDPLPDERRWNLGAVAFGYNMQICDAVELIHEISADFPQGGESWAYAAALGFLATLP
jgi:hypothetical protein